MLACLKCGAPMVSKDRNGIMIEECRECRGVYLDHGELELLIDAESRHLAALPDGQYPQTAYRGRHRHGVVQQIFGGSAGNGQLTSDSRAVSAN